MANETSNRGGRPPGRVYTGLLKVPLEPETETALREAALKEERAAAAIVRDLIKVWLAERER